MFPEHRRPPRACRRAAGTTTSSSPRRPATSGDLAQAAAHLTDTGRSIARHRDLPADRARLLDQHLPDTPPPGLPEQQRRTVAALWEMSIEQADSHRPRGLARPLLELAAVLRPDYDELIRPQVHHRW